MTDNTYWLGKQNVIEGLSEHRLASNPEELRISEAFKLFAERNLAHLLYDNQKVLRESSPLDALDPRDAAVACTVIQWLGSPVGQAWLRDLGYVRNEG